jgi:hypothetical protein
MIKTQLFPISATDNRAGILILPDDYDANPDLCPLIVFSHGVGEAGDGTLGPVAKLYNNGSPLYQGQQGNLKTITCPVTGKVYRPIIFGLQGTNGWCVQAVDTIYAIQQLIKAYPKIDTTAIMATGLSAGGENTWEMIGGPNGAMFAAAVPMSTPAPDLSIIHWANAKGKVWAFHGTLDGGQTAYQNSINCVNAVNAVYPGDAYLTSLQGGGHGPWAPNYDPATTTSFMFAWDAGKAAYYKAINIYQFLLACKNANFIFQTSGTTAGINPTPPVSVATKAVAAISLSGNTLTLDATGSTGNGSIAASGWFVGDANNAYVKPQSVVSGQMDNGKGIPAPTVITLPNGSYNISLTVYDQYGGKDKKTIPVTVGAIITGPTVVGTFTDAAGVLHTAYSDNTWK